MKQKQISIKKDPWKLLGASKVQKTRVQRSFAQATKASERRVAGTDDVAASAPSHPTEVPTVDVPPVAVREPEDTHGEDFAVTPFDVEDVPVAIIQEEPRLAVGLGLDEARDVFQGREMALRQFPADVPVVSVLLEEGRDVGTFGSRKNELAVFDVEPFAERIPDIEPGTVLVELRRIEGLRPCRNGGLGDGLEKRGFGEQRILGADLLQGVDDCPFDFSFEYVEMPDDQLGNVFAEKVRLSHCRFGSTFSGIHNETNDLPFLF